MVTVPGTSFCGASIGKIDAFVFIGGLFIGVLIFGLGYNIWDGMYLAKFLGSPKISETLGLSDGVFAFLLINCCSCNVLGCRMG